MEEKPDKTQLVGSTHRKRAQLKETLQAYPALVEQIQPSAWIRGCSTTKATQLTDKEKQRFTAAKTVCGRQRLLPVSDRTKVADQRCLVATRQATDG